MTLFKLSEFFLRYFLGLEGDLFADAGDGEVVLALLFQATELVLVLEDFKWQMVRGYIMKKFDLKVSREDILNAARSFVTYQYAMYGMAGMPQNLIDSAAENMLQDKTQYNRLEEQCEDNAAIARVREEVTLQTKKISMDKFRELK